MAERKGGLEGVSDERTPQCYRRDETHKPCFSRGWRGRMSGQELSYQLDKTVGMIGKWWED